MLEFDADARGGMSDDIGPADDGFAPDQPEPEAWWKSWVFDDAGSQLAYQGESWTAEELATSDPTLADYVALSLNARVEAARGKVDLAKDKEAAANINNLAGAIIYADPTREVADLRALLDELKGHSKANQNQELLPKESASAEAVRR